MQTLLADLRYGVRMLSKSPGFTLIAVVTLALCVGANTAIFTLVNAILLRPLPYPHADRLMWVTEFLPRIQSDMTLGPDYVAWRDHARSFEQIAAYDSDNFNASGAGEPLRVESGQVTSTFFPLFNLRPLAGRPFSADEDRPGAAAVTILTYGFWQSHFGGQPDAIGKSLVLNGAPYAIVGVLPPDFRFPDNEMKPDILLPLPLPHYSSSDQSFRNVYVAGRLAADSNPKQATAELNAISAQLHGHDKSEHWLEGMHTEMTPLREHVVGDTRRSLLVLLVAVGFVLLIGCVNIANLQLARASARQREMAVRTALGAGRLRLVRLLLTESLLLSSVGGGAGFFLATWLVGVLGKVQIAALPHLNELRMDGNVFGFTLLLVIITGVAFGSAPAIFSTKQDAGLRLDAGGPRTTSGRPHRRMSNILVVSELALALVLLAGAGLLIRTFVGLARSDPGFKPEGLLTARIVLSDTKYAHPEQRLQFLEQLLARLQQLPGVEVAAVGSSLPLAGHAMRGKVQAEGQPEVPPELASALFIDGVSSDYFRALGMALLKGRTFSSQDAESDSAPGVILNQAAAAKFFPGHDPVGKHIRMTAAKDWSEIIGLVGDVRDNGLDEDNSPQMYLPLRYVRQVSNIAIRTQGEPGATAGLLRHEVLSLDPAQPIFDVMPMETRVADSLGSRKFNMLLLTSFAGLALSLAGLGIYGVIAYTVAQRTHEIGIRVALGADRVRVLRLVMGNGATLGIIGVGLGLAGALALSRFMSGLLYGIGATDALTMVSAAALMLATALLASYVPARRAAAVDPAIALRYE